MRARLDSFLSLLPALVVAGCMVGDYPPVPRAGDTDPAACEAPMPPQDPSIFEACCQDYGGGAHCVPDGLVPGDVRGLLASCDGGGLCVPDPFIESGGAVAPRECNSINGAGRCMSVCVPQVQQYLDILTQDVCDDGERCAPCVNPLTNELTGACEVATCGDDGSKDPITCPYQGPALIDPSAYPSCPACTAGGAHCLPTALVPGEFANRLASCDASSLCVPDDFIASMGKSVAQSCASVGGAEGRCLSPCLPEVADQADRLPQSSCNASQVCVPCTDPLTGQETGACGLTCDAGPTQPPMLFPDCCSNRGKCVPTSLAGADASKLGQDVCPDGQDYVCAPTVMIEGDYVAQSCSATGVSLIFGSKYKPGACMPDCLPDVQNPLLGKNGCDDGYKCAPCYDPLTGNPSGACDYLPPAQRPY